MQSNSELIKTAWNLVSDFVCWEFCRNSRQFISCSPDTPKIDLMSYFREMVIEMTSKHDSEHLPRCEIVAKFVEELSCSVSTLNFETIYDLAPLIQKNVPELTDDLNVLLAEIRTTYDKEEDFDPDKAINFCKIAQNFSSAAFKHLPFPDLLQICKSRRSKSKDMIVNEFTVTKRLIQERENLFRNVTEILKLCRSNSVYKQCLDAESSDSSLVAIANEDCDDLNSCTTVAQSSVDVFVDCASELSDCEVRRSIPLVQTPVKSRKRTMPTSHHPSPKKSNSPTQYCTVVLSDVSKSRNRNVHHFYEIAIQNQNTKVSKIKSEKVPVPNIMTSSESDSDDDFEPSFSYSRRSAQMRDCKKQPKTNMPDIRRSSRLKHT